MRFLKRIIAAVLAAVSITTLSGCRQSKPENGMMSYDFKEMNVDFIQLAPPKAGDKIAIIDTDYGEVRVVLYEDYAPKTVENFIKNAEEGIYDDMSVKGVRNDVYFLTGGWEDKKGNYTGRNNNDELITNEYSVDLWPFAGALMGFSDKAGCSDARWFIVNNDADTLTVDAINELKDSVRDREDAIEREKVLKMFDTFYETGGFFGLAGENTVFGQTYLGLDVVQKLTQIPANDEDQATKDVKIKSVKISEFKEGDKTDEYPRPHIHEKEELDADTGESSEAESNGESSE